MQPHLYCTNTMALSTAVSRKRFTAEHTRAPRSRIASAVINTPTQKGTTSNVMY